MFRSQKFPAILSLDERRTLQSIIKNGRMTASLNARARALLLMGASPEGPAMIDFQISEALGLSMRTISRLRKRFSVERLGAIEQHKTHEKNYSKYP